MRKISEWRRGERKKKRNDTSHGNLWLTDDRNSLEQEEKFVNALKTTLGYRNMNFLSKFQKAGVSPTLVISCLVALEGIFRFNSNLKAVFIDGQGPDPVF